MSSFFHTYPPHVHLRDHDMTDQLSQALSALPQMTELKRCLDVHFDIATSMLEEIKGRKLDKFYEVEMGLPRTTLTASALREVLDMVREGHEGTVAGEGKGVGGFYVCF